MSKLSNVQLGIIIACAIMGISLIVSVGLFSNAYVEVNANKTIEVTGQAKAQITSDSAVWTITLNSREGDRQASFESIGEYRQKVLEYLKNGKNQKGEILDEKEIVAEKIDIVANEERDSNYNSTGYILYYEAKQNIVVTSDKIYLVDELSRNLETVLGADVVIESNNVEYNYKDLANKKLEMVTEATKDAVARGKNIVKTTGKRLGSIKSAKTGVFQITKVGSNMVDDYGMNDLSTIEKEITCTVKANFYVD